MVYLGIRAYLLCRNGRAVSSGLQSLTAKKANVYLEIKPKPNALETTARQQIQRMSVIWESESDARLIVALVTGYPRAHFLPLTGDPETGVFTRNLDELHEAIEGSWRLAQTDDKV
jgi:hypothetical protein